MKKETKLFLKIWCQKTPVFLVMSKKTLKTLLRYVIGVIRYRCQRQSARKSEKLKPQGRRCGVTGTTLMWCAGEGDRVNPVRSFLHEPLWGGPSTYHLGG